MLKRINTRCHVTRLFLSEKKSLLLKNLTPSGMERFIQRELYRLQLSGNNKLSLDDIVCKLFFGTRQYVPPICTDCIHNDHPYKDSNQLTDAILNELKNDRCNKYIHSSTLRNKTRIRSAMSVNKNYRQNKADFVSIISEKYKDLFNIEMKTNVILIFGFCKQCVQHLFIKTNGTKMVQKNIKQTINKLYENKNVKWKDFNALWMNIALLLIFLLHPTFGLTIPEIPNIFLLSMNTFFKTIQKYFKKCINKRKLCWKNLNFGISKQSTHPLYEGISVMIDFCSVFNQYLGVYQKRLRSNHYLIYLQLYKNRQDSYKLLSKLRSVNGALRGCPMLFQMYAQYEMLQKWVEPLALAIRISMLQQHESMDVPHILPINNIPWNVMSAQKTMKKRLKKVIRMKQCGWRKCNKIREKKRSNKWYKCKECRLITYCCRKCQKRDWNKGTHRNYCASFRKYNV